MTPACAGSTRTALRTASPDLAPAALADRVAASGERRRVEDGITPLPGKVVLALQSDRDLIAGVVVIESEQGAYGDRVYGADVAGQPGRSCEQVLVRHHLRS